MPALEHDGFTMYESRAISRYVDDVLPGPKLVPEGAKERAAMEQWVSFEQSYFSPVVATVMFERLLKPAGGGTTDEAAVSAALTKLGPVLDVVERRLGASEFLAGSTFSLADVFFLPHVEVLAMTKATRRSRGVASCVRGVVETSVRAAFLEEGQGRCEVSGLGIDVLTPGTGARRPPRASASTCTTWARSRTAPSSTARAIAGGRSPSPSGAGQVIKGWDQGVAGMKVGEVRRLTVPADLGYGARGFPPVIPPNATLVFEVELLAVG